jgi:hypothetical protein
VEPCAKSFSLLNFIHVYIVDYSLQYVNRLDIVINHLTVMKKET